MSENEKLNNSKQNNENCTETNEFNPYLGEIFECESRSAALKQGHC